MPVLRKLAINWYRKVFGAPAGSDIREQGLDTVLDGNTAVALSEAGIATHAVLGGSAPASPSDAVWLGEVAHGARAHVGRHHRAPPGVGVGAAAMRSSDGLPVTRQ